MKFERVWKNFARAAKITKEDRETQVAALLNVIGDSALDLYETFTFTPPADAEDEDDAVPEAHITVDAILAKFREYCEPKSTPSSSATSSIVTIKKPASRSTIT